MTAKRYLAAAICAAVGLGILTPILIHAQTATAPAATQVSEDQLKADLRSADKEFQDVMPMEEIADADYRKKEGPKAIVPLKKMVSILAQIDKLETDPEVKSDIQSGMFQYRAFLVALGDADVTKELQQMAAGTDAPKSFSAKSALALGTWISNSGDAKAQAKQLDDYIALAKANPASDDAAVTLVEMANLGASSKDLITKAEGVIKDSLTSGAAKSIREQIVMAEKEQEQVAASLKVQADMIGKPIPIAGRTSTGAQFSVDSYKGKVVIVDFWATWCGPCRAIMPGVKAVYQKYHGQGLEIVGVSCDAEEDTLNSFISENNMPWIELHDKDAQSGDDYWHPLTHKFGIIQIPTMYLIDKKGILRDVEGDDELDKKVADLLAEKNDAPAATQPAK